MAEAMTGPTYGGLISTSPLTVNVAKACMPTSITLKSTDGTRKIEISCDGGTSYFQPTYDQSPAAFITVAILAPITHAKFTGAITDTWTVI